METGNMTAKQHAGRILQLILRVVCTKVDQNLIAD